ncbi:unnamed protein product [Didymodactylos carnosus]|uniref:Uncharacterized protein n=1 Tax=Didymodactylos carnosus TaxID=1234261 RepID=A0A815EM31_9BILA|nr:unnamed protein product [Didymodactylos carnosus]CAF4158912.1 unnamed protein product [Didymodactylos carnosus]
MHDASRRFYPFGVDLISSDEAVSPFVDLFKAIKGTVLASTGEKINLSVSCHVIKRCREHRNMVPKDKCKQNSMT